MLIDELGNEVIFRSAVRSSNRKTRFAVHKRLICALNERGYRREKEVPLPEMPTFPENPTWETIKEQMPRLLVSVRAFSERAAQLDGEPYDSGDHWIHSETGQRILDKELHLAMVCWPLDDVLALIP